MRRREGIPHETANAMVDVAAAAACCLVGGSADGRSVAAGDGSAAADGGAEHGAAKTVEQPEAEAHDLALASELYTTGSLNIFAHQTNVNTDACILCYDIRELDEQLRPVGMVVTLDAIFNRVIRNWRQGKRTWILADEFYILFRYSFSAEFFYRLFKRMRKYNAFITAISQNVDEILRSDTARLMLANSELLVMLNQAATDREELAKLLNISENQLSYITNVPAGHGIIRCGGAIIPFENSFPKNTKLYRLMTTKPNEKFL